MKIITMSVPVSIVTEQACSSNRLKADECPVVSIVGNSSVGMSTQLPP